MTSGCLTPVGRLAGTESLFSNALVFLGWSRARWAARLSANRRGTGGWCVYSQCFFKGRGTEYTCSRPVESVVLPAAFGV